MERHVNRKWIHLEEETKRIHANQSSGVLFKFAREEKNAFRVSSSALKIIKKRTLRGTASKYHRRLYERPRKELHKLNTRLDKLSHFKRLTIKND